MALKTYEAFTAPSPYDQERMRAERLRRYAELLQQQSMEPEGEFTYQGIRAMPSPAAALGKMLQAYQSKKALEKAEQAEAKQAGMEQEASSQIMGRLIGGRTPGTMADLQEVTPAGKIGPAAPEDLTEVQLESQYTRSPEDAMRMAMSPQGVGAVRGNPMLAAMLTRTMEKPETKTIEFGDQLVNIRGGEATPVVDASGKPLSKPAKPKAATRSTDFGGFIREYYNDGTYQDVKKTLAPSGPRDEPLMSIVGPDGKPVLARRSEAEGKQPFFATMAGGTQLTGDDKVDRRQFRAKRQELQNAYNSVLGFVKELKNTPKEESLFGEKAGRLASNYKLALGAVRVLQNTGVLNVGELPFIEDTLRNPQSISQLFNPASRATISGQVESILDLLEQQSSVNDEIYGYDVTPLKGRELRGEKIPAAAVKAGLTQADWDAATEEEKAAWR